MEQVNASELPPGVGFLTVTFPANAKVYISGRYLGMANKPLQVRCGQWFVRLARPTDTRIPDWVSAGKSVSVACQGVTQVAMQPTPGKALE
jgi:serine/threonine-protein kinase